MYRYTSRRLLVLSGYHYLTEQDQPREYCKALLLTFPSLSTSATVPELVSQKVSAAAGWEITPALEP